MKTKKGKIILLSCLAAVLVAAIIAGAFLIAKYVKKQNGPFDNDNFAQTVKDIDTYDGVDKNFSPVIKSQASIAKSDLALVDQNGDPADFSIVKNEYDLYSLKAPAEGWTEGNTYELTLLNDEIKFNDEGAYDKQSVTFTVDREDVLNAVEKDSVIAVENSTPFDTNEEGTVVYIDPQIIANRNIKQGSIIIVPVLNEFGFTEQTAYKVTGKNGNGISVEKPDIDEVFEEVDIKGSFDAVMSEEYFHFYGEEEIEEQILESEHVKSIAALSESGGLPKIKISLKLQGQTVKFSYKVTFPRFFDECDFVIEGTSTVKAGAKANIDLMKRTVDVGAEFSYKNEMKYSIVLQESFGGSDSAKGLQNLLNRSAAKDNLSVKIYEMYIPTPIAALGFSLDVAINFKVEMKVELGVTFTDEYSTSVGVKRVGGELKPYFNKSVTKESKEIELCGSIEAKLGLSVKFSGSLCGILKAGVEFEIGAYAKVAGFAKAKTVRELTEAKETETTTVTGGCYFELGIYSNLNLFAEIDLKVIKFEVKYCILEIKIPVFSIGFTQMFQITPQMDSIVFDEDGKASLPDIIVKTLDMFDGKTTTNTVKAEDVLDTFKLKVNSNNVGCKSDGQLYIKNNNVEELSTDINLRLKVYQNFLPKIDFSIGGGGAAISIKGTRGVIHLELGALLADCNINVSKQPVAVEKLTLGYESVKNDEQYSELHPELTTGELVYSVRDAINGINDYQIGRLVRVVPEFTPYNASYKHLKYTVEKGAQYIVGGTDGISVYDVGGITYATFRVIDDETAVGNQNGKTDIGKEIKLSAVTTGYEGKYASWNKTDSTNSGIFASAVPVRSFELTPVIENTYVSQTAVQAGDVVKFEVDRSSVYPKNATRGNLAGEALYIKSGNAEIVNGNDVVINSSAKVGNQIVVASMLSGVEREYFLNIVKTDIESIEIAASNGSAKPGDTVELSLNLFGENQKIPTVSEVVYAVVSGGDYITIQQSEDLQGAVLNLSENAKVGSVIKLFAIADGKRSNTVEIGIDKIAVETVTLTSESGTVVHKGETVRLQATVLPENASFKQVRYSIVSGAPYAILDSYSGKLVISNICIGGEVIELQCVADGVTSETLKFVVQNTDVQYVMFPVEYATVRDGQTIKLDAFVNPDATNKNITYSIVQGNEFARIEGDSLIIEGGLSTYDEITVCATSVADNDFYAEKQFTIFADNESLSINGEYDTAVMFTGESATAVVTDSTGNIVNNRDVLFTLTSNGKSTDLAKVDADGLVTISTKVSPLLSSPTVELKSNYNGTENVLYIDIRVCPDTVELVLEDNEEIRSTKLKPGEQTALKVITVKQDNASELENLEVETSGALNAYIESEDEGYGLISYRIIVQISPDALTDEICTVSAKYIVAGKVMEISNNFAITVERITEEVHILNIPQTINVAESITLQATGFPENVNYSPVFEFADYTSQNYAVLNSGTGELTVKDNVNLAGRKLTVRACVDGVYSQTYTIEIVNEVLSVKIGSAAESIGVQYIPEYDFYFLYPNGKFVVSAELESGGSNSQIHCVLDAVGQEYLSVSGNEITVKHTAVNSGINATLVAYAENGVVSNLIVIYIPAAISSVDDWLNIQNNITGYYVLTNDIDFSGVTLAPLPKFGGILDGCGHSVLNLSVTGLNDRSCFGLIEENYGMVFNLKVSRFSVKITESDGTIYGGAICAKNYGYINNCTVVSPDQRYINIATSAVETYVGGVCGYNGGTVKNCSSRIYVNSYGSAAGIAGYNSAEGYIVNSSNTGYISAHDYGDNTVAGIAGFNLGKVENSTNLGKITNN